jgi:hypothetical protein
MSLPSVLLMGACPLALLVGEPPLLGGLRAECLLIGLPVGCLRLRGQVGTSGAFVEPAPLAIIEPSVVRQRLDQLMEGIAG